MNEKENNSQDKSEKLPRYLGHRHRLRERFLVGEGRDMSDNELLELVLMAALPRRDVKPLVYDLMDKYKSIAEVINAPKKELLAFKGIKENTYSLIKLIKQIANRVSWENLRDCDNPILLGTDLLVSFCRANMAFSDVEEFRIIYLNAKLRVIGQDLMQRGTINSVALHPREVVKAALSNNATSIIMVHNHPSGDVRPSKADVMITEKVRDACKTMSINLLEHLIISNCDYFSFADNYPKVLDAK